MSTVSMNRRAQQAGYLDIRDADEPLWDLQLRLFDFTNKKTGYNLSREGQEPFTVIQYNVGDEYTYIYESITTSCLTHSSMTVVMV
jgi:hypothetical protein